MRISSNAHRGPCHLWCALNWFWLTWTSYFLYFKEFKEINKNPAILVIPTATIPFKYNSKYESTLIFHLYLCPTNLMWETQSCVSMVITKPFPISSGIFSAIWLLTYPAPKYHPNDPLSRVNRDLSIFPNVCLKAEHETQLCMSHLLIFRNGLPSNSSHEQKVTQRRIERQYKSVLTSRPLWWTTGSGSQRTLWQVLWNKYQFCPGSIRKITCSSAPIPIDQA